MFVEKMGAPVGNHVFIVGIDAIYYIIGRNFRTKPLIFTEIWTFRNFSDLQIFWHIGAAGFWLDREIFQ